ncbi:MAG: hypothetical protein ACXWC6_05935 [Ramlibacter sp.]
MNASRALWAMALAGALGGCAHRVQPTPAPAAAADPAPVQPPEEAGTAPPRSDAEAPSYRCDGGVAFTVRDDGDFVLLRGLPRGDERLGRDAGGVTPSQTVYSSATLRAEFGLGSDGRDALLHDLVSAADLHCRRD